MATRRRTASGILRDALALLDGHWTKGTFYRTRRGDGEPEYCAVGAIRMAVFGNTRMSIDGEWGAADYWRRQERLRVIYNASLEALAACTPRSYVSANYNDPMDLVVSFNDNDPTDFDAVASAFRCAMKGGK